MSELKTSKTFYWTRVPPQDQNSPSGWYQWQSSGLVYLGESMLNDDTFSKQETYS